jgi:hypothetical protein
MIRDRIDLVKVFSVTNAKDREGLGERVTAWIAANPDVRILTTIVALTSDREFHCLSMVLICSEHSRDAFVMSENQ